MTASGSTSRLSTAFTVVFLVSSLFIIHGEAGNPTRHVTVSNDLGEGIVSTVHCQSKDDDLCMRTLNDRDNFYWEFKSRVVFGHTLFWCRANWRNVTGADVTGAFDAFNAKHDNSKCVDKCWLSMRQDGIYFFNQWDTEWVVRSLWGQ